MKNNISKQRIAAASMAIAMMLTSISPVYATSEIVTETEQTTYSSEIQTSTYPMTITVKDTLNNVLDNLEFKVTDQNGNEVSFINNNGTYEVASNGYYSVVTTDNDGLIHIKGLEKGTYTLSYENNDNSYVALSTSKIIVDSSNSKATIQLKQNVGNLVLSLIDEDNSSIKGAKFNIKDENNNVLKFVVSNGIYVPSEAGNETIETTTAGKVMVENLPVGNYVLIQTEAPVEYNGALATKNFSITLDNETRITANNTKEYGDIKVKVVSSENSNSLNGSEFNILDKNGNKISFVSEDGVYKFTRTGGDATVKTTNGLVSLIGLPVGEYTLTETKTPSGYDKASNSTFSIEKNKELSITVKNIKSVGSLEIVVKDATTNETVKDYTFNLLNTDKEIMKLSKNSDGNYSYSDDGNVSDLITDENGKITISGLPVGNYFVKQSKAASGYIIDNAEVTQTINSQQTTTYEVQASKSNASINVVDEEGNPIENISVVIKDEKDNIVIENKTNENGKLLISGIPAGKYTYSISNIESPFMNKEYSGEFSIDEKGEVQDLDSCIIEYTKIKVDLGEKVEGAVFMLQDKNDESITFTAETNKDGIAEFIKIPDGEYILSQTEAAEGYNVSTDTTEIVIDREYKEELTVDFANNEIIGSETTEEVEEEKENSNFMPIVIALVVLLVIGATVYAVIKTKKDNDSDEKDVETTVKPINEKTSSNKIEPVIKEPETLEENDNIEEDLQLTKPETEDFLSDPYTQESSEVVENQNEQTTQGETNKADENFETVIVEEDVKVKDLNEEKSSNTDSENSGEIESEKQISLDELLTRLDEESNSTDKGNTENK